jgi:hypothetical protein
VFMECYCIVPRYSEGWTLITCSFKLVPVKQAGRTIDVMQILFVSMHNYIYLEHIPTRNGVLDENYIICITL